jgi:valyl-tRNA synthetase
LWPFSTLGWPEKTEDLNYFYPTNDLVSAAEILFFWISRMIMAGLEVMGEVPFSNVLIHGTVRDIEGRKMSKSLGNSIDPLETINQVGADALRFTLMTVAGSGQDALLSEDKFDVGRNFTNKIWNATRFSLLNLEGFKKGSDHLGSEISKFDTIHQWIVSRLNQTASTVDEKLSAYRIGEAAAAFYDFFWGDFCDWYLELIKPLIKKEGKEKEQAQKVLFFVLEESMRLLQPFMPHLAEEVWHFLKNYAEGELGKIKSVMIAPWPSPKKEYDFPKAEMQIKLLQSIVVGVRDLRGTFGIEPARPLRMVIKPKEAVVEEILKNIQPQILHFARVESLQIDERFRKTAQTVQKVLHECEVFVFVEGLIDREAERLKIEKEIARIQNFLAAIAAKLENENFIQNAPQVVVQNEREKEQKFRLMLTTLQQNRSMLEGE